MIYTKKFGAKSDDLKSPFVSFHHRAFTAHNILNFFGTVVLFLLSYCILLYH